MKITYYKCRQPNFGDELNPWMWPKLLPGFFDDDEKTLLIGIGSIIGDHYDPVAKKIVLGAGFVPHYFRQPDVHGNDWDIYFVRGPRTAKLLDLSPELALGDSAILLRTLVDYRKRTPDVISFMPHWESMGNGYWEQVCRLAGINLIDPRRPVEEVIKELLRSKLVVTESMHGAIVADAFRIPWVPVFPIDPENREKWFDWAESLKITLQPHTLWPSRITEAHCTARYRPRLGPFLKSLATSPFSTTIDKGMIYLAARKLAQLAKVAPTLSDDNIINGVTGKMQEKLQQLQRDYTA